MTSSREGAGDLWTVRAAVDSAVTTATRRASRRSAGWWRTQTVQGRTRAEAVTALTRAIAGYAADVAGEPRRTPPDPKRDDVLPDQLAVVAYDLVLALATPADPQAASATAHRALAETLLTTYEIDPRPADPSLTAQALAGDVGAFRELLERLPLDGQP